MASWAAEKAYGKLPEGWLDELPRVDSLKCMASCKRRQSKRPHGELSGEAAQTASGQLRWAAKKLNGELQEVGS